MRKTWKKHKKAYLLFLSGIMLGILAGLVESTIYENRGELTTWIMEHTIGFGLIVAIALLVIYLLFVTD